MNALGHEAADMLSPVGAGEERGPRATPAPSGHDPRGEPAAAADARLAARAALEDADPGRAITVPFAGTGSSIPIQIELEGSGGSFEASYLFDTGASYTTITTAMAEELGIAIPDDAPTLEFNTALGRRQSKMVHLPALTVGDVRIESLLVSICDTCANETTAGLLGLNVMREFFVEMDYQGRKMQLLPRVHEGRPDRAYDIEPILTLEIDGKPEIWLGRIRWIITVTNRGTVAIEGVVPRVVFDNGTVLRGEPISRVDAGATGRSLVIGKVTEHEPGKSLEFTLSLAEAYW
jgi:clan AA aspartic protease (TIGR02281 family)